MISRRPHTIPYSNGRLEYEITAKKIATIEKDIPLTEELIEFIVGKKIGEEKEEEVSEDTICIPDTSQSFIEKKSEIERNTWTDQKPTAGRVGKMSQMLQRIVKNEDMDEEEEEEEEEEGGEEGEGEEEYKHHQKRPMARPTGESSEDETQDEGPAYDIEERGRELREQEEKNAEFVQELADNLNVLELKYFELKQIMDRHLKTLIDDLRCEDEELEDLREDIESVLEEEYISSFESVDGED
ncbi:unnamed protein product [Nezara viridula]|uniref:Uncharacterized protein n=1 Tax=Nezara viridula TaxID=85310 RepID=A0A9P0DXI5_NEZVI|nr:unnamed protein product [Nezara viridula]